MSLRLLVTLGAALLASAASAGTFVLDDFDGPNPPLEIFSPTGTIATQLPGPYGRALVANGFIEGPVAYSVGGGSFVRTPLRGSQGETILAYLRYGSPTVFGPIDLSPYKYLRLDFNDVTGGDPLNLNFELYNPTASAAKPYYYLDAGVNYVFSPTRRTAFIAFPSYTPLFDLTNVQGLGIFVDRSGSGRDGFSLDRISFTQGVPEPATWATMVGGFGLVGGAVRRRRATVVAA